MESILVSDYAIAIELRRAASAGLLSNLTSSKLHELALKYFGIYENGELVGYQCPYSGKKITNPKKIVLEHIIPISRGGGTVLFNCIPTSVEVNKSNEKGTKHLINWWKHPDCKYWNKNAPVRLEKIINYLIEGYEITINEENLENSFIESYSEDNYDNDIDNGDADLSTTQEDEQKRNKNESIITYYGLMNDLINALSEYTDVSLYQEKLQNLIKGNVFEKIKRQTLIQKHLKDIIKNKLEIEDRSELTYTLNINISNLSKSLEKYSDGEIYSILEKRIDNLESILDNNNLSLDSFFSDKNSLIYLYKESNGLTDADITNLVKNINMIVADKFNAMIEFVINNAGLLPSAGSKSKKVQKIGQFRYNIQSIRKNGKFTTTLSKTQLQYLYDSEYASLRELYKTILYKAVINDIEIDYVDEEMKNRILEFKKKSKLTSSLEEEINLEKQYKDVIVVGSQFNEFVEFVINNAGLVPNTESKNKNEKKIGQFKHHIQSIKKNGKFYNTLTKAQLQYLHNSEYASLRELYKIILYKAVMNNIEIDYVDEKMKNRILEFKKKSKLTSSLEEEINLEKQYKDVIVVGSQFNEFVEFVINNAGLLPSTGSKNEKKLGGFRYRIQSVTKEEKFAIYLTKTQLQYLHDSEYEGLREIYKNILYKAVMNNIEIDYVDEKMKLRMLEYKEKFKLISSLEEEINLEKEYKGVIIIGSQFNEFIEFVNNSQGRLPSKHSKNEKEQKLGGFRSCIQCVRKEGNFVTYLTKTQLQYLHDSEYASLRELYKTILYKAVINDIEIDYVDEKMKNRILEFKKKYKLTSSLEEEINLEKQYKDVIVVGSQFNEFMEFVINNAGLLPSDGSKNEKEQKLGQFRHNIQSIRKNGKFYNNLTKSQLQYLHNSEYKYLREIYKTILYKAVMNNIEIDYVDEEMKIRIQDYKKQLKSATSLEEEIKLEKEYNDVIIVESQFNKFMGFVNDNYGVLPSQHSKNEKEKKLGRFRNNIQKIKKEGKFSITLTKSQLQYLHNSEYESLRNIYDTIIAKAISVNYDPYIEINNELELERRKVA